MSIALEPHATSDRELILTRLLDAPRAAIFKAWSDPELLMRWWAPAPWSTVACTLDLRSGGAFHTTMRSPDGSEFPHGGVFLDVVPLEKIVFTDAFSEPWIPSAKPFMTAIVTMSDEDGKTRYTARALHWSTEDRDAHENMGFQQGWGLCAEQLAALARTL